ncbi:hypothetical protein GCM10022243_61850 [Saccharothrix violaceirubra]
MYLLRTDVTDDRTISAALEEVARQLTKQQYRMFRRATEILRGLQKTGGEVLLDPARREKHRKQVEAARGRLASTVKLRLNGAPALPPAEVAAQARTLKVPRSAILAALRDARGDVREPAELPPTAEPRQWAEARGHLTQLRQSSLWDYVTDLGGVDTTVAHLSARREKLRVARNADSAAETTLLQLIRGWIENGGLAPVLRYELLTDLADRSAYGYDEALSAAKAASGRLRKVGVTADPAAIAYAVWCGRAFTAAEPTPSWQEPYQQAIGELRLRAALTVLRQQPNLPETWVAQRTELEGRLAALDAELERCEALERADVEAAVTGYLKVRQELVDDRIDAALERCRPAPPASATATIHNGQITVAWPPSPARAGRITYRVSRAGTVLDEGGGREYTDREPPSGTPLVYAVHALRDGTPSAEPARTAPVVVLGEVLDLDVRGGPDAVTGRWRLPPGAAGAEVTRSGRPVADAHSTTFTDPDLPPGRTEDYLVRVRYRLPDGTIALSTGLHRSASRQETPVAVTDLSARFEDRDLVAEWTPPPRGEVEVLELPDGRTPPEPDVVPVDRARRYGTVIPARGASGRGRLRATLSSVGRRQVLLPITVLGELAAIGTAFTLDARQSPVSGLRADRLGTAVQLTWEWPPGSTSARVVWRPGVKPTGPEDPKASAVDLTRVSYDGRGFSVTVPEGDHWFGVCTSVSTDDVRAFGPLSLTRESTVGTVSYQVVPGPWYARKRRKLIVGGTVPVVLVARSGVRPMNPSDGEVLVRAESGGSTEFEVPAGLRRPVHLRAFSRDDRVVLVPTRPDQLIVRGA